MKLKFIILLLLIATIRVSFAGGLLVVYPDQSSAVRPLEHYTLSTRNLTVNTIINDQVAKTEVDQTFYNASSQRLEGYFLFPVPKGAQISSFFMDINGKMMQAELLDAKKARDIYEDIVRSMKDPALLEFAEQDLFKVRIFPIEPRSEKRIKISYNEVLLKDHYISEYTFPLNTKKFSATPLQNINLKLTINTSYKLKTLYSPSHVVKATRKDENSAVVSYQATNISPIHDFKLYMSQGASDIGASLLSYRENNEDGFFFLDLNPGFFKQSISSVKAITFVLDVSGSMAGEKLIQAKKALNFCINNLNTNDAFEVVRFSTEAESLFGKRVTATPKNMKHAIDFVDNLKAIGGTNIDEALEKALSNAKQTNMPHMVIFITDGKPTIGETQEHILLKKLKNYNLDNTRIFTFGIGYEINTHLLDKITETSNAYRSYITPEEDIEVKISNFFQKVNSPILTDIKIFFEGPVKTNNIFPKRIPDLFKGSAITLFGRFKGYGMSTLRLEGKVDGRVKQYSYKLTFPNEEKQHAFIAPLWAARKVGYLLDQIRLHGESKELIEETTLLAKQYGVITPYTSYLILEDEQVELARRNIVERDAIFHTRFQAPEEEQSFKEERNKDFDAMHEKSGAASVRSSQSNQMLSKAKTMAEVTQNDKKLNYIDRNGQQQNLAQQTQMVNGRAFYQSGTQWVDINVQKSKNIPQKRIAFGTSTYFELIRTKPQLSSYLSLGKNVRFVHNNVMYEIY